MPDDSDISALSTSADTPLSAEASASGNEQLADEAIEPSAAPDPFAPELQPQYEGPAPTARAAVERAELPDCFASIECQLQKPAISKLKVVDSSMAMIQLKCNGQTFGPIEMAYLVAGDFATNCIQALGTDGLICCAVNDKKYKPFFFAFQAQASESSKAIQADPMQALTQQIQRGFQELEARHKKEIDDLKLEVAISGSGGRSDSRAEVIAEMKSMFGMMKEFMPAQIAGPQVDISGQMQGMVQMFKSVAEVSTELKTTAGIIAKPEKSFAEEAKELLEIDVVKDVAGAVVDGVKAKIAGKEAVANPASEPNEPDVDPFAAGAA